MTKEYDQHPPQFVLVGAKERRTSSAVGFKTSKPSSRI